MEATTTTEAEGYIKTLVEVLSRRMAFATKNRYNYGLNRAHWRSLDPYSSLIVTHLGSAYPIVELAAMSVSSTALEYWCEAARFTLRRAQTFGRFRMRELIIDNYVMEKR
ncbi:hypothetical protein TNCV_2765981 [Trichonephila clavipes]|nr:hypothetical protein TNCV_2765981 [Trichonephila clavipes]